MLLTITTTHRPATDLGHLLHKHPGRCQRFDLSFGAAHVFYPEATDDRCAAALLLDVDPIGLVRGPGATLEDYVNDRPYVASSFMSVAIAKVFGTALGGRCGARQQLAESEIPLEACLTVVAARGGEPIVRRLFEPLGYDVAVTAHPLDERFPEWGDGRYLTVTLAATARLCDLLAHLYVLVPVLDDDKHYYVGEAEIAKLLRRGEGWLAAHPDREMITRRYLRSRELTRAALARLVEEDAADPDETEAEHAREEAAVEERVGLNEQRLGSVLAVLRQAGAARVLDLGCGEGKLIAALMKERGVTEIVGVDVSHRALQIAARRLKLDRLSPERRERVQLLQGSLTYRDRRLAGFDAAAVVEVVEHLDQFRLRAFERVLFEFARPRTVVLTTPNVEYNVRFEWLPAGSLRHRDHRFEWTREQFREWASGVADRHGYAVRLLGVGPDDAETGPPTQMAVFSS
jgi:3' terminal RNA ribose 2'-O-methyltransferase Hen1